ncbi:flagellar basal body-associated FliL family protein [Desulfurobacterium crinifex]
MKKFLLFLLAVFVFVGGGGVLFYVLQKGEDEQKTAASFKIMELEPIVINLSDGHYIRIAIALGYTGKESELKSKLPAINDILITTVGAMSSKELISPEGKELLKENLLLKINSVLSGVQVRNIFYREFIVQ